MKIENKDFWEKQDIIATQEVLVKASDFEMTRISSHDRNGHSTRAHCQGGADIG